MHRAPADGISAIICTRNRRDDLRRCLDGLAQQSLARAQHEVWVIDNGSSDGTRDVAEAFCARHPHFHYHLEERTGLSVARNTGVRLSSANIVAFTDDDAVPEPDWLERLLGCFRGHPGRLGMAGGDVVPVWEVPRPDWLNDALLRPLSAGLHWGPVPRLLRDGEWLVEVNSAYNKADLLAFGGFPEGLGRVGDSLLSGEGGVFMLYQRAGISMYYDPAILVRHHIPASRLTRTWFRRRAFWQGVSMNRLHRYVDAVADRLGVADPTRHARTWEEVVVPMNPRAWAALFDDTPSATFDTQCWQIEQLGYLLESQSLIVGR